MLAGSSDKKELEGNQIRVPRITRVWFEKPKKKEIIAKMLKHFSQYTVHEQIPEKYWRFESLKSKFEVRIMKTGDIYMLDCKRCRGCGIQFKRVFRDFKDALDELLLKKNILPHQQITYQLGKIKLGKKEEHEYAHENTHLSFTYTLFLTTSI